MQRQFAGQQQFDCADFEYPDYADYFEDHADPIQRALRALAGDVGHAISQEMYTSAHSACTALSALLPFQK